MSAVVEKLVVVGLVVLFISGFGTALFGGVVPEYRASAADEVAQRSLAAVAESVEAAVPTSRAAVNVTTTASVPATVAGRTYRIELAGRRLHLRDPNGRFGASTRVAIPASLTVRNGSVPAGTVNVRVSGEPPDRELRLEAG
jgi:hypothetical protein